MTAMLLSMLLTAAGLTVHVLRSLPATTATASDRTDTIVASGSTAQLTAMNAWRADFQAIHPGTRIGYRANGSGAGVRDFIGGATAFAGSDRAMNPQEQAAADSRCRGRALHLPMVAGPIAVAYNLPSVPGLRLSPGTLAGVFGGRITAWDDPSIAAENPGADLPQRDIEVLHRSDDSGTSHGFAAYLAAGGSPSHRSWGTWPVAGRGVQGSDGMARAIRDGWGSIGYVEYGFAGRAGLATARVRNGAGEFVALSPEGATQGLENARIDDGGGGLVMTLDYTGRRRGAYPIVVVTYEIVCARGAAPLTRSFLRYAAGNAGQSYLSLLGYAPMPQEVIARVRARLAAMA
ncbi:phosphate ABC transporter substrate-binding protein PstS [Nonomuraea sp. NPDC005501]|uniref:phosphate ABC transporter substrate-binding protein PstS n=1 Tax=Nonomuraea sp. NPDC005501 TaxID=3156884 RepID=UPI0033B6591C